MSHRLRERSVLRTQSTAQQRGSAAPLRYNHQGMLEVLEACSTLVELGPMTEQRIEEIEALGFALIAACEARRTDVLREV